MDDGRSELLRLRDWPRERRLVRLTLFASEMSKGTVSAAMGMLQMLIFTVGIELNKHAYELGGNGLFSLFNLLGGVLWLGLMIYFLKDKSVGNSQQGVVVFNPDALASGSYQANGASRSNTLSIICRTPSSLLCGA